MDTEFEINQQVVYPSQGVGKIIEIFNKEFKGETLSYYKIYIEASDMIVMVPITKATELGIRHIVDSEQAKAALELLSEEGEPITSDWKLRYQMNLDLLKKGTIKDIATIVRCLYNRSKVKELPILERKLYDSAKKLLIDEISLSLGIPEKDVEGMIHVRLEPPGAAPRIKHVIQLDDDADDDLMDDVKDSKDRDDSDEDDETNEGDFEDDDF